MAKENNNQVDILDGVLFSHKEDKILSFQQNGWN
jgi:hypothetical protein